MSKVSYLKLCVCGRSTQAGQETYVTISSQSWSRWSVRRRQLLDASRTSQSMSSTSTRQRRQTTGTSIQFNTTVLVDTPKCALDHTTENLAHGPHTLTAWVETWTHLLLYRPSALSIWPSYQKVSDDNFSLSFHYVLL